MGQQFFSEEFISRLRFILRNFTDDDTILSDEQLIQISWIALDEYIVNGLSCVHPQSMAMNINSKLIKKGLPTMSSDALEILAKECERRNDELFFESELERLQKEQESFGDQPF